MHNVAWRIARKELLLFFASPIGYLFLAAYLAVTLFVFFWGEAFFARNIADVRPMFEWLPVLLVFLSAALTMRMWSEERRSGTLEFVVTVPASAWHFVLGKFLACWSLLGIALALTLPLPVTVALIGDLDWGPVFAGYVAALLLGAAYLAIGLYVSAKSESQIVALILTTFACGMFYFIGSQFLTDLFGAPLADLLRALGSGSRFESITRGVLDFRDLYFYVSVVGAFLALNVYAVERQGWAHDGSAARHNAWRTGTALVVANVLLGNVWLAGFNGLRVDVSEGRIYSISDATRGYLAQLREPLLIRGYFSAKTHPLLAPLVPQIKDLLLEYEVAGDGRVRVELIDPADEPELEDEANTKYGIRPVPFQVADRYQASLVNSYFDVLVQYGDEYEVLGFRELIEVKVRGESDLDVKLRNPEYDITRSVKKVLFGFQGGGDIFDSVTDPVTFTVYASNDAVLPPALAEYRATLTGLLDEVTAESGGKFGYEVLDPDADGGALADEILVEYGFRPMAASLFDQNTFYFYLTLSDGATVVQIPLPEALDADGTRRSLDDALKRFTTGLLKRVAFKAPAAPSPYMGQQAPPGNQFADLRDFLAADFDLEDADLASGSLSAATDLLLVVDPTGVTERELFAMDQYLMRGGTLVIANGAFQAMMTPQSLMAMPNDSGLDDWLVHHGVTIERSFVMDPQNAAFPVPVTRNVGGFTFQDVHMIDYPYFVDVRDDGLNQDIAITAEVPQVTMTWTSPLAIDAEKNAARQTTSLLQSSVSSWRSSSNDIMPKLDAEGLSAFLAEGDTGRSDLAVLLEGRFDSFFDEPPASAAAADLEPDADGVEDDADEDTLGEITTLIERSPESARLIVFGSSTFLADQTIRMIGSADGLLYTNSIQMMANLVDWSVEDQALLSIRSRGHFNRTLPPMAEETQRVWELANYAIALLGVLLVFGISRQRRASRNREHAQWLEAA